MPSPRLAGLTARRSRPSSRIAPEVGSTKPAIICSVVVLPQPDGPSSETNSPFSTPSDSPSTAVCWPNCLVRFSSSRKAIYAAGAGASMARPPCCDAADRRHPAADPWSGSHSRGAARNRPRSTRPMPPCANTAIGRSAGDCSNFFERRSGALGGHEIALAARRLVMPVVEPPRCHRARPTRLDLDAGQPVPLAPAHLAQPVVEAVRRHATGRPPPRRSSASRGHGPADLRAR